MSKPRILALALLVIFVGIPGDVSTFRATAMQDTLQSSSIVRVSPNQNSSLSLTNTENLMSSFSSSGETLHPKPFVLNPPPPRGQDSKMSVTSSLLWYARNVLKCCTFTPENEGLTKAAPDRIAVMCIKHHIYVDGDPSLPYNPDEYTKGPYAVSGRLKNSRLVSLRKQQIEDAEKRTEAIFRKNGLNIHFTRPANLFLIPWGDQGRTEVIVDSNMKLADLDWWGARGYTLGVMDAMRQRAPHCINVHWVWGSMSAVEGIGKSYDVVIADNIPGEHMSLTFVHELVHALGYETHLNIPGNLMADNAKGEDLTWQQRSVVWKHINRCSFSGTGILVLSCPNPIPPSCVSQ